MSDETSFENRIKALTEQVARLEKQQQEDRASIEKLFLIVKAQGERTRRNPPRDAQGTIEEPKPGCEKCRGSSNLGWLRTSEGWVKCECKAKYDEERKIWEAQVATERRREKRRKSAVRAEKRGQKGAKEGDGG